MNRRLSLKREALADLTTDELTEVAGAQRVLSNAQTKCTFDDSFLLCTRSCVAYGAG